MISTHNRHATKKLILQIYVDISFFLKLAIDSLLCRCIVWMQIVSLWCCYSHFVGVTKTTTHKTEIRNSEINSLIISLLKFLDTILREALQSFLPHKARVTHAFRLAEIAVAILSNMRWNRTRRAMLLTVTTKIRILSLRAENVYSFAQRIKSVSRPSSLSIHFLHDFTSWNQQNYYMAKLIKSRFITVQNVIVNIYKMPFLWRKYNLLTDSVCDNLIKRAKVLWVQFNSNILNWCTRY